MKSYILLFFISITVYSCWLPCNPIINIEVVDNQTEIELDSCKCDVFDEGVFLWTIYTDESGIIQTEGETTSSFMGMKDCSNTLEFKLSKTGYKDTIVFISQEKNGEIIKLRK